MKYRNSDFFSPEMINLGGDYVLMLFIYLFTKVSQCFFRFSRALGFLLLFFFYFIEV